jgi:hypothetical protein
VVASKPLLLLTVREVDRHCDIERNVQKRSHSEIRLISTFDKSSLYEVSLGDTARGRWFRPCTDVGPETAVAPVYQAPLSVRRDDGNGVVVRDPQHGI